MTTETNRIPPMALWLTWLGVVPFVFLAAALFAGSQAQMRAVVSLAPYGAVVLSFLGGIHWGFALAPGAKTPPAMRLLMGVVPALAGWAGATLDSLEGFSLLAVSFVAMLVLDANAVRAGAAPRWYLRLRVPPTIIAVVAMLAGASTGLQS